MVTAQIDPATRYHKQAQLVIAAYAVVLAVLLAAAPGRLLVPVFPLSSFAVGVYLYRRAPRMYVSFAWWLVFLGPVIRRMIDYRAGALTFGPWIFTSLLVVSISAATFFKDLPHMYRKGGLPFLLASFGVAYAFLVGILLNPKNAVVNGLLGWFCPITFGYHLFANWRDYPIYRKLTQRTFLWGVLVMGAYGVFQFLVAPEWEKFWLNHVGATSFGTPEPLGIRVSSTLSSPQTFASVMMAGLMLLFSSSQSPLYFPATGLGYLSFLLSMARTAWLSWIAGLPILLSSLKPKLQMRLLLTLVVTVLLVIPIASMEQFSETINSRFESLTNTQDDTSLNDRREGYDQLLKIAVAQVLGSGFGGSLPVDATAIGGSDSTLFPLLFTFGWFGTLPYLCGVLLLMFELFRSKVSQFDPFNGASRAIVSGLLAQFGFNLMFVDATGIAFWAFLGIGIAADKFYTWQSARSRENDAVFHASLGEEK